MSFAEAVNLGIDDALRKYQLAWHSFPIIIDSSILRLGEQMSALDKPLTLGDLKKARDGIAASGHVFTTRRFIDQLEKDLGTTDFVRVSLGGSAKYTYKIAEMPARRVQVGDLVAVPANAGRSRPQVVRVVEVNVPEPRSGVGSKAVAISPEDAERIEAALGRVR